MSGQTDYAYDVFLSYSEPDKDWVSDQLYPRLEAANVDYYDESRFVLGQPEVVEIERGITESRWTLLILSDSFLSYRHWAYFAGHMAHEIDVAKGQHRTIPALKGPCELPLYLRPLVKVDLQAGDEPTWQRLIFQLLDQSNGHGGGRRNGRSDERTTELADTARPGAGLGVLSEIMRVPKARDAVMAQVRDMAIEFRADLEAACEQIDLLANYKRLHDQLHDVQRLYECIRREQERFLEDERATELIIGYEVNLRNRIHDLKEIVQEAPYLESETSWIRDLIKVDEGLKAAIASVETAPDAATSQLQSALIRLAHVLDVRLAQINSRMYATAGALRLPTLTKTMLRVRNILLPIELDDEQMRRFKAGVRDLVHLDRSLPSLRKDHDQWQEIDSELRRIESNPDRLIKELELSWPLIRELTDPLCGPIMDDWAMQLKDDVVRLDEALTARATSAVKRRFISYRRNAGERFLRVDKEMKGLCDDLRSIGQPLASALETMS